MNPKDLEVLKLILRSETPMALPDVLNAKPSLVKSTTAASLAKFLREGLIEVAGIGHSGKVICRTYRATKHAQEFLTENMVKDFCEVNDLISKADLCMCLLRMNKDPETSQKELAEIRAALDKFEKENHII